MAKLFCGNLPATYTENELRSCFEPYGVLEEVVMLPPRGTSGTRCGFAKFVNPADAETAKLALNGAEIPGHGAIEVRGARDGGGKPSHGAASVPPPPGSMAGGYGNGHSAYPAAAQYHYPQYQHQQVQQHQPQHGEEMKLFIGGLPPSYTEADVGSLLEPYPGVSEVYLLPRSGSQSGSRCGFVRYRTANQAQVAMQGINGMQLAGCENPIVLRPARGGSAAQTPTPAPQPAVQYPAPGPGRHHTAHGRVAGGQPADHMKLFIGNLPASFVLGDLERIISVFPTVTEVHLMDRLGTKGMKCGFARVTDPQVGEAVVKALNDQVVPESGSEPLTCRPAKDSPIWGGAGAVDPTIVVGNLPESTSMDELAGILEARASDVVKVSIGDADASGHRQGFATLSSHHTAYLAARAIDGLEHGGEKLTARFATTTSQAPGATPKQGTAGRKAPLLHVFNLPDHFTDADLQAIFENHGTVVVATVVADPDSGASKGMGTVMYADYGVAMNAAKALDGYSLDSSHRLRITLAGGKQDAGSPAGYTPY